MDGKGNERVGALSGLLQHFVLRNDAVGVGTAKAMSVSVLPRDCHVTLLQHRLCHRTRGVLANRRLLPLLFTRFICHRQRSQTSLAMTCVSGCAVQAVNKAINNRLALCSFSYAKPHSIASLRGRRGIVRRRGNLPRRRKLSNTRKMKKFQKTIYKQKKV